MIKENRIYKIILSNHISEKTSNKIKKDNIITLKVAIDSNKIEIKNAINKILNFKVKKIKTLIIKGKMKKNKGIIGFSKKWKKAYVTLKKGQETNYLNKIN